MLDKQDIEVIQQLLQDQSRNQRDFTEASEKRILQKVEGMISNSQASLKHEIIAGVAEVINEGMMPQLEDHEERRVKLEVKL